MSQTIEAPTQRSDLPGGYQLLANPRVLPTALSLRFAVLVLMIMATAATVYGHLATLTTPTAETVARQCLSSAAPIASAIGAGPDIGGATALRCLQSNAPLLAAWSAAGLLLVILLAALLYAVHPWFASRSGWRRRLPSLSPAEHPDIAACVAELADQLGMSPRERPTVLVDPDMRHSDARTFGWQRRSWIRVTGRLLVDCTRRPGLFRGILLHELAHVRNRDNRATNLTIATWRAFVAVVLLPYLVGLVAPGVFGGTIGWQWPNPRLLATIVVLTVLVYLTKASVLRARETHADAVAYQHDPADSLRTEILAADNAERWVFLRNHFPSARRRAMLGDPVALAAPDGQAMFGAGVAISVLMVNVVILGWWSLLGATGVGRTVSALAFRLALGASRSPWDPLLLIFVSFGPIALLVAAVVAGLAGVTGWRAGLLARHGHGPVRTWRSAVPLALGMMLGLPLSAAYADAGTWGVFDTSVGNDIRDVVLTALALLLILTVLFRWSAECATAWLTDDGRTARRLWLLTVVLGTVASVPFVLIWSVAQDNAAIGFLQLPQHVLPPITGWPAATVVLAQYLPLNGLGALPGAIALYGLAAVFPLFGAIHRRAVYRRAMWLAPVGAAVAVVVPLGLAILLREVTQGDMVRWANTVPGVRLYLLSGIILLIAVIAALAGVVASRLAGELGWSVGLFVALTSAALASVAAPVDYVGAVCGPTGFTCVTGAVPAEIQVYGGIAQMATTDAVLITVLLLLLASLFPRPRPSHSDKIGGSVAVAVIGLFALGLGAFCFGAYFQHLW